MNIRIQVDRAREKHIITVEHGFEATEIVVFNMTIEEVAQFVKTIMY